MKTPFILLTFLFVSQHSFSQQTVGLFTHEAGQLDGYVLFAPIPSTTTYLIDKCGKLVHTWSSAYRPGQSVYLLEDGSLLRTGNTNNPILNGGGTGGIIEKIDWDGNILWSYTLSTTTECQHHDIFPMTNGNILAIVWQVHSNTEAIAEGRNPSQVNTAMWSEKIVELQPVGSNSANIVWEWYAWDHLVQDYDASKNNYGIVADHPELIDINFGSYTPLNTDWLHINSVHYNPQSDQAVLSVHNFNEIWIIDHSTTTAEAAMHNGGLLNRGGDLLYRWGNPAAYDRGNQSDKKLFGQHNAYWIEPGFADENKIMVFNNQHPGNYSSVDIIEPPLQQDNSYSLVSGQAYLPVASSWTYTAPTPTDFYAANISGAQRLSNGNTLVCEGTKGKFFELDANDNIVWEYINPVQLNGPVTQGTTVSNNIVFRCTLYEPGFAGFAGRDLTPGEPVELNPFAYSCDMITEINELPIAIGRTMNNEQWLVFPNPAGDKLNIVLNDELRTQHASCRIINATGQVVFNSSFNTHYPVLDISSLQAGIYFIYVSRDENFSVFKFVKE